MLDADNNWRQMWAGLGGVYKMLHFTCVSLRAWKKWRPPTDATFNCSAFVLFCFSKFTHLFTCFSLTLRVQQQTFCLDVRNFNASYAELWTFTCANVTRSFAYYCLNSNSRKNKWHTNWNSSLLRSSHLFASCAVAPSEKKPNYWHVRCLRTSNLSCSSGAIWHSAPAIGSIATLNLLILRSSNLGNYFQRAQFTFEGPSSMI